MNRNPYPPILVVEHKYLEGRWLVAWAAVYRHIHCWTLYAAEKNVLLGSISIHHACKELSRVHSAPGAVSLISTFGIFAEGI
jgi:hypothetical protein